MSWGTLTVGRLTLKENYTLVDAVNAASGDRSIALTGVETSPNRPMAELVALGEDLGAMLRQVVPITFSQKADRNGYYEVQDVNVTYLVWQGEASAVNWTLSLNFIGPDNAVDIESRLANVVRANDFVLAGERTHAPPIGHYSYQVGTSIPATVVRTGEAGAMTVYRAIPANTNPRWGSPVASYLTGAVRILNNSVVRSGVGISLSATGWEISNGLLKVKAETVAVDATLRVSVWSGGAWHDKVYDVQVDSVTMDDSHFKAATVTRNDPEACSVRIAAQSPNNSSRRYIDVLLRRGSRFAEVYVQRPTSGEISCTPDVATSWVNNTVASGYVIETGPDAFGNKAIVGSAKTCSLHASGGITKLATTTLDFYVGAEVAGSPPLNNNPFFEVDASDWSPFGCTFVRSTAQFHQGVASGLLTPDGVTATVRVESGRDVAAVGASYKMGAWVRCATARNVQVSINWFDAASAFLSGSGSTSVAVLANTWTYIETPGLVAPALTGFLAGNVSMISTPPVTDLLHIDEAMTQLVAVSGDGATAMRDQYIGAMSEMSKMVKR